MAGRRGIWWSSLVFCVAALITVEARAQNWIYTVRPGDTLWDLSEFYLLDVSYWKRAQELNGVQDPAHMPPGLRLRFPVSWLRVQPLPATITAVAGQAQVISPGAGGAAAAAAGALVYSGDEIVTGPGGSVVLGFADGADLTIASDSRVVLDKISIFQGAAIADTRLRLRQGRARGKTSDAHAPGARYEISTPFALSAVRGTELRVGLQEDSPGSRTEVLAGRADASSANVSVSIPAGFGTVVGAGAQPLPPRRLLPPPDLSGIPPVLDRVPIRFSIPSVAGAAAYRMEVAADATFQPLSFEGVSATTSLRGPDSPDGIYHIRVRGIDALGLEGRDSTRAIVLDARPEPPFPIEPIRKAAVPDDRPTFRWTASEEARSYWLQLAAADDFAYPVFERRSVAQPSVSSEEPLSPGWYEWRVATTNRGGDTGPFSDPERFRVPQPGPQLEPPDEVERALVFRWRGAPDERYQVQVAKDRAFANVLIDRTVDLPELRIDDPQPGEYFVHVRSIDAAGLVGNYGPTQTIEVKVKRYWALALPVLIVIAVFLF